MWGKIPKTLGTER